MKNIGGLVLLLLVIAVAVLTIRGDWLAQVGTAVDQATRHFSEWWKGQYGEGAILHYPWMVSGLLGVTLLCLICGVASSLVVSHRMAFFSDALAHCAFAGIAIGIILYFLGFIVEDAVLAVMIVFGALVGVAIAFVKEQTSLADDTVIGVFFAGAVGFGAILLKALSRIGGPVAATFSPETFLFGDILLVSGRDLVYLVLLLACLLAFLFWLYNPLVFIRFNPSLGRSRNFPVKLCAYAFTVLLALLVNICLKVVGVLIINGLLILPAATARNLAGNLRQFFWLSAALSMAAGVIGILLSDLWEPKIGVWSIPLVSGGTIVMVGFVFFLISMLLRPWLRGGRTITRTGF